MGTSRVYTCTAQQQKAPQQQPCHKVFCAVAVPVAQPEAVLVAVPVAVDGRTLRRHAAFLHVTGCHRLLLLLLLIFEDQLIQHAASAAAMPHDMNASH
jgi:hypothetical protein